MSNLDTVRETLEAAQNGLNWYRETYPEADSQADDEMSTKIEEALTALTAIEADHYSAADMADAQAKAFRDGVASVQQGEPVAWGLIDNGAAKARGVSTQDMSGDLEWEPLYRAAPVAQQPSQCGLCGADEAFTGTCGGGKSNPRALCYGPVAQQPQAETHKPLFAEAIAQHPGLREELKAMDDPAHPLFVAQAEAVPDAVEHYGTVHDPEAVEKLRRGPKVEAVPLQVFESDRAKTLMKAWQEGWDNCRDSEYVGEEAQNDAFNQSRTLSHCIAEDMLATPQQAEAVLTHREKAAVEILQHGLGWTYHDGEWLEDKAATETLRQQAEAVPPGYVVDRGFRWDGENQQHIPQLTLEFDPVPANGPCDAKGWKDRDAVAQMFAAQGAQATSNETSYAGVKVWIGDKQVVRIVTEAALQNERLPGLAIADAAIRAIAAVQEAHVDN